MYIVWFILLEALQSLEFFHPYITPLLRVLGLHYAYRFLCELRVICVLILVQIPSDVPEFSIIFSPLSYILITLLRMLGLRYAYSFLCKLRLICVPILVQIASGVPGF